MKATHISSLGYLWVTDIKKNNNNKSRVKQEPRSAHGRAVNKSRAEQEPRSAHGRAVKKKNPVQGKNRARPMAARLNRNKKGRHNEMETFCRIYKCLINIFSPAIFRPF